MPTLSLRDTAQTMSQENVKIARRAFKAFNERDTDALHEVFTIDVDFRPAFLGGGLVEGAVFRGHAGMTDFLEMQAETWERAVAEPMAIQDLGDHVLVEVRLDAVGRASGIPVNRTNWNVLTFRDGKIATVRVYTTKEEAFEAIGLSE
jgi:ketosteroid isomerase-like protein